MKLITMTFKEYRQALYSGKVCPYCKDTTVFASRAEICSQPGYGMIYLCRPCRAWVSVHKGTDRAMGRLANAYLRSWKREAHRWFDPIAITGLIDKIWPGIPEKMQTRGKAYLWLARQMNIDVESTHIAMFDTDDCKEVVQICKPLIEKLLPKREFYAMLRRLSYLDTQAINNSNVFIYR